jgi:hemoglobin
LVAKYDIETINDIKLLVDTFYKRVQEDALLGPVFNDKITDWDKHHNTMYTFWETVLLNAYTYRGVPYSKHANLPINKTHFDAWVELFGNVVDELFTGNNATNAKQRAAQFGTVFSTKMEHQQKNK